MNVSEQLINYIKYANLEKFKSLIEKTQFDINHCLDNGDYLLHYTITCSQKEIAFYLLNQKADLALTNNKGQTPFMLCLSQKWSFEDKLKFINSDINIVDANKESSLFYAINYFDLEIIQMLLDEGININHKNQVGDNALFLSIYNCFPEALELLLNHQADITHKNADDSTLLSMAASYDDKKSVELLLTFGANIREVNNKGDTAFLNALLSNNLEIAKLLYFSGINLDDIEKKFQQYISSTILNYFKTQQEKELLEDRVNNKICYNKRKKV